MTKPLFPLGTIVATPAALAALAKASQLPTEFLNRHAKGDWGTMSVHSKAENDAAVKNSGMILSSYSLSHSVKIWVVTEWDRSVTTILLPEEY